MTTIVTIDMGGTGATHAAGAREALSVPSMTDMGQSYAQANSARDQANTARGNANDAYSQANTAYSQANSARDQANTAYGQANSARSDANTTFATINTTFGTVNTNYQAAYAQANTARTTANDAYGAANTKLASAGGTLSGDLIITGNLTVSGNQTILNTEVLTTEDADIILLSNTSSTPALNAGLIINRGTSTNTFLRWDEATDKWGWSDSGTTTYYFEDLRQGLSTTNTTFGTINTSLGTINTNYQAAYSQANTAGTNSLNAYGQANSAYGEANNRVLKAGDTMTGQLNVSSGGLLVTGNVGFGTASPSAKLHILTGSNKNILFKDASHTTLTTDLGSAITFSRPSDGSNDLSGIFSWNNGGLVLSSRNEMIFATGGTGSYSNSIETMRITRNDAGTGNVGIGTASPIFPLQVKTNTGTPPQALQLNTTDWTTTIGSAFQFGFGAATGNTYSEIRALSGGYNAWNNLVLQSGGGNVGIGTTSPAYRVQINRTEPDALGIFRALDVGAVGAAGTYIDLGALSGSTATAGARIVGVLNNPATSGYISFNTLNSSTMGERMIITAAGNVGIGTTSPSGLWSGDQRVLHLFSSGGTAAGVRISSVNATAEFFSSAGSIEWGLYSNSASPFTIYTNGSERLRITSGGNIGIGTSSVDYGKVHIKEGGITAAAISTGWPAYNAETATQSKYVLFLDAGSNGSVTTQGQGPSVTLAMGGYYDSRGIITMIGAGGGSPSDGGNGYGKDLMVKGGNSDNGNGYVGGRLFLAGGSGYSGGAYNANYGAVVIQPQGGNVGIGTTSPTGKLNVYVDADTNISIGEHPSYGAYNAIWTPSNDYVLLWQNGGHTLLNSRGSGNIFFREDNNDLMTILNGGNVGIGTASPTGKLHIYDTSNQSSDATLYIQSPSNNDFGIKVAKTGYDYGIVVEVDSSASYGISIYAGGSYVFRATGGGNLLLTGTLTESSSIELKENIDPITNALDSITKLVGVTYDRKDGSAQNRAGLIAEEVGQILPNVVNGSGIQYTNLIAYLVESIKELKAEIDVLKRK